MKHIFQNENEVWYFCHLNLCLPALFWLFSHLFHPLVHLGLESVICSYVSVIIVIFNILILICGGLLHLSPMCVQFQTSCVSFVLLALGLCFFWTTWVQDDAVQKIWFMIFIFYIYITKMTFQSCFSLLEVLPGKEAQAPLQHTKTSNLEKNRLEALLRWKSVL